MKQDERPGKFRTLADNMQKQIDEKRNPGTASQNLTARRARIMASMAKDADRLERIQTSLRCMADAIDAGGLPESLERINSMASIRRVLLNRGSITEEAAHVDLVVLIADHEKAPDANVALREQEHRLIGVKIPGFFPTPHDVIRMMMDVADLRRSLSILEPSAGKGDIADMLAELIKGDENASLSVIEINYQLRDLLRTKGHNIVGEDFLDYHGEHDRILMNPPFEHQQDIEHVRHAHSLLRSGGRLVSLMSASPFSRDSKKSVSFREWFWDVGGRKTKLPDGSFKGCGSFRQTGVAIYMVVIDK